MNGRHFLHAADWNPIIDYQASDEMRRLPGRTDLTAL